LQKKAIFGTVNTTIDLEHEELYDLCSFKDFMEDISTYLQKVIDGDI